AANGRKFSEDAFRHTNIVARKNRDRLVDRNDLLNRTAGMTKINLLFVGAIRQSTSGGDGVWHSQTDMILIFARLLDLAHDIKGRVSRHFNTDMWLSGDFAFHMRRDRLLKLSRR